MTRRARLPGADAVVVVDLDDEVPGSSSGLVMVCASGTAVELAEAVPGPAGGFSETRGAEAAATGLAVMEVGPWALLAALSLCEHLQRPHLRLCRSALGVMLAG